MASGAVYRSDRTRILRLRGHAVGKEFLGPDAPGRARREAAILGRLAGLDGVPRLIDGPRDDGTLVLEDLGDTTLGDWALDDRAPDDRASAAITAERLLAAAVGLADVLAEVHEHGVIHRDVNPGNVMVAGDRFVLIDFDLATTAAEERPAFGPQDLIVGTLAYLAPEQTGRTGRPVDQRCDLYSLGATLYELATGRPPFGDGDGDPLRLIHDHLARAPEPVVDRRPDLPPRLGAIIERLLEKDPDRRYQSARGLAFDLRSPDGPLGERDFPARLAAPSRQLGRDAERAVVRDAFHGAVAGRSRGVLVTGPAGVGKTSLIDELRPLVTAAGGWYLTGKFDQHRQDTSADAMVHAMRALARMLIAEPAAELTRLRTVLAATMGGNEGLIASVVPELGTLLGVAAHDAPDSPAARARLLQGSLALLRAVVSPTRPLVVVVDDLQWAAGTAIAFVDALLLDDQLDGLLVVGAYRDAEVDAAHPLTAMLDRWQRVGATPPTLRLANLPAADLASLLAGMLRMPAEQVAGLAEVVAERTGGNPFDTVELLNALRGADLLTCTADGWRWEPSALRRYVGDSDVTGLLEARIAELPRASGRLLTVMAALGGETGVDLLQAALDVPAADLFDRLDPALADGLVILRGQRGDPGASVHFRHDRVQHAAYGRLPERALPLIHLVLGRRLAAVAAFAAMAAQQYLPAAGLVREHSERQRVAALFHRTAAGLRLMNAAAAERYLAAADSLLDPDDDTPLLRAVRDDRHRALSGLGRFAEADAVFEAIALRPDPMDLAAAATVQIGSLTVRQRAAEALALGRSVLRRLDIAVPDAAEQPAEIEAGLDRLRDWIGTANVDADVARDAPADPRISAASEIVTRMTPAAFYTDPAALAWIVTVAQRLWTRHGPSPALLGALAQAGNVLIMRRSDYRTAYATVRHLTLVGEARGWRVETGGSRFVWSFSATHWFEPLENGIAQARTAREELLSGGDLQFAAGTYHTTVVELIDCASTLDEYLTEVRAGVAFATRTGNMHAGAMMYPYRRLAEWLGGEQATEGGFDELAFHESIEFDKLAATSSRLVDAIQAVLMGEPEALVTHTEAVLAARSSLGASYPVSTMHLLWALATGDQRPREILAERAADAPVNYRYLVRFLDAEAAGDFTTAAAGYEEALRDLGDRSRPWHRALITERYAACQFRYGFATAGRRLLAEACDLYQAWGAETKVRALRAAHPELPVTTVPAGPGRSAVITSQSIDVLAILRASQALSAQTTVAGLRDRLGEVLGSLTGATAVRLLLWQGEPPGWRLPPETGGGHPVPVTDEDADRLPLTVARYVERTREPLLISDATRDDRFARDPFLARLDRCSVLAVPIVTRGALRALLIVENELSADAFTAARLDAVTLVAGQLAVSIENTQVYAELEERVAARTEALREANRRLDAASRIDALTGLSNRGELDAQLATAWDTWSRTGRELAVAMIDIDHFKLYNDRYGHPAGDRVLQRVAEVLNAGVRDGDTVARYGGEEFTMILPGANTVVARQVADRVRRELAELGEPHEAAPRGIVTVSIGVAAAGAGGPDSLAGLMSVADAQLYQAKLNGRNRVAALDEQPSR